MSAKDTSKLKPEWTAASGDLLAFLRTPFSSPYPVSKAVDFEAIFSNKLGKDAIELLKTATEQRKKLMEVLADTKTDSRNVIAAVDAYLPSLWRITASMQASESKVHLVKKMEFKWTSMLNKKGKEFSGDVLLFETAFVLTIRAILHRDAAKIIQEQNTGDLQEMAKELRMGAGIFQFVGNELLTRWESPPDHRAPEAVPLVHHCLAALYLADAQRLAIVKALASETSPTTLAKLFIGCAEKYEFATRNLSNVDKEVFESMVPGVLEELGAWPAILRGCASNCLAQSAWARGEFGKGLGYAIDGTQRLQVITMGKGLQGSPLQESLNKAIARALALELEYQNDCNNVYFEKVNKDIRMVDGAFVVNPIVYELPLAELVNFADGPMPVAQQKMKIQSFWTALWAKPESYPTKDEHVAPGNAVAGATELPGVNEAKALAALSITGGNSIAAPEGVDASVFSSLPLDIQREIAADASRATGRVAF